MKMPRWLCEVLGLLLAVAGALLALLDVYTTARAGISAHMLNVGVGVGFAIAGAYIMVPVWTKAALGDAAAAANQIASLRSGRRASDPRVVPPLQPDPAPPAAVLPPRPIVTDHDSGVI